MGTILKLIFSVGIILVILGLILNPLFIEKFVSPDQRLDNPSKISSIIFFELVLILVGCTIILLRYRILKLVKRYNYKLLYIILVLVILLIIVEIVIRMLIKNPVIELPYFNIYYDYWLIKKPQDSNITTPYTTHPSLGWDFKQNFSSNCHNTDIYGAKISKTGYDDSKQNILFFGDSFTESRTCSNNSLPAKLEKELDIYKK